MILCSLNICYCSSVDVGFKEFSMGCVRGRGLGALAMSTRVGKLCVVDASFKEV